MAKKKAGSDNKDEDSERAVIEYMRKVNRPYSANDIFNNLHGKHPKPGIVKILERLTEQEALVAKTYGKTPIYTIKQNKEDMPSKEDKELLEAEYEGLKEELTNIKEENRQLSRTLAEIKKEPTTEELKVQLEEILKENEQHQERLVHLKSGSILVSEEERIKVDTEYDFHRREWRSRRKMFKEIFTTITENMPGDPQELKETLGIEEDPISYEKDVI
ncbi:Tat binding protein 1-interacting protein-domain-containing protein [Spinellus fusiger]|nr:Tat binding protein 1-interacting protein-domain-containing protein [Spinellus fusiger]